MGAGRRLTAALWLSLPAAASAQPAPEPSATIVEFPRGAPVIGFPARCPDSPPEGDPPDTICLAELYQGRADVVRHLGGPRIGRRQLVRLTAHARSWRRGTRMLIATIPFRDGAVSGHFAYWWDTAQANGDFCEDATHVAAWEGSPLRRAFEAGYRRRFRAQGYVAAADFLCIRG